MNNVIKEFVYKKYGSVDKFIAENHKGLGISRTQLYRLVMLRTTNPTIRTIFLLSQALGLPWEDVASVYISRHRD